MDWWTARIYISWRLTSSIDQVQVTAKISHTEINVEELCQLTHKVPRSDAPIHTGSDSIKRRSNARSCRTHGMNSNEYYMRPMTCTQMRACKWWESNCSPVLCRDAIARERKQRSPDWWSLNSGRPVSAVAVVSHTSNHYAIRTLTHRMPTKTAEIENNRHRRSSVLHRALIDQRSAVKCGPESSLPRSIEATRYQSATRSIVARPNPINRYQLPAALFNGKTVWPISLPPFRCHSNGRYCS